MLDEEPLLHCLVIRTNSQLLEDIEKILDVCPEHALEIIQKIPVYINSELWFGLKDSPTRGRGMCYHSHQ